MIDDDALMRYNTAPSFCAHALDRTEDYYRKAGVSRMHQHDQLNLDNVRAGDRVFVKTDALPVFCQVVARLSVPVTLVTGISDIVPEAHRALLDDPRIVAWCGPNLPQWSDKVLQLPIGFAEKERASGNAGVIAAAAGGLPWHDRPFEVLVTPMAATDPERAAALRIPGARVWDERLPHGDYLALLGRAKFVICPRGNGPDTIRLWEALAMGAVPVTRTGILDPLYRSAGVVTVDDWQQVPAAVSACTDGERRRAYALDGFARQDGLFFADYWHRLTRTHHDRLWAAHPGNPS